jgi:hypothetical protein
MMRPMEMAGAETKAGPAAIACRLCGGEAAFQFTKLILNKHLVGYWRCAVCGCLQTDAPHWLGESYRTIHSATDTGMVARTWQMAQTTSLLPVLPGDA